MIPTRTLRRLAAIWLAAGSAAAQPRLPAVHPLDRPIAVSTHDLASVVTAIQLPNGSVLVSDARRRQLILLDSALRPLRVVADSVPGVTAYGNRPAPLLPYISDSTVLVLAGAASMYVIDREGKIARTMAAPRPEDAASMATTLNGAVGYDWSGRIVYRGALPRPTNLDVHPGGPAQPVIFADTVPLVRADPSTHRIDTLATLHVLPIRGMRYPIDRGRTITMLENNPVPVVDDWGVFTDGTVGVVRGRDYHVDFINAAGADKGPRMAYQWEPLSDEAKTALVDSLKRADQAPARPSSASASGNGTRPGQPPASGSMGGAVGGSAAPLDSIPPREYPSPQSLPDYRPPFGPHAVHPDSDNDFWIQTTHRGPFGAGDVYDVVDRHGAVVDRVQLQPGRTIAGFGTGGVVLLRAADSDGTSIERVLWRRPTN
jgi:hypothetical protein